MRVFACVCVWGTFKKEVKIHLRDVVFKLATIGKLLGQRENSSPNVKDRWGKIRSNKGNKEGNIV